MTNNMSQEIKRKIRTDRLWKDMVGKMMADVTIKTALRKNFQTLGIIARRPQRKLYPIDRLEFREFLDDMEERWEKVQRIR